MRILVTGGQGQLGTALAQLLARHGVEFSAPGRSELDITDQAALAAAMAGSGGNQPATAVIHAAAYTKVDDCEANQNLALAVNAHGTERLARLCAQRRIPLVYVSTDFVFDGRQQSPYEIDDPVAPLSVYGASKLAGEQAVRVATEQHYVVRTSWVFGQGQNFPRAILRRAARGEPLRVVNDQVGAPTYAQDLAQVILLLLGLPPLAAGVTCAAPVAGLAPYGIYHVTNEGHCSWFEFAVELLRQAGWAQPVAPIDSASLGRPARRPAYSVLSLARLSESGVQVRSWPEAVSEFLAKLRLTEPELFPIADSGPADPLVRRQSAGDGVLNKE